MEGNEIVAEPSEAIALQRVIKRVGVSCSPLRVSSLLIHRDFICLKLEPKNSAFIAIMLTYKIKTQRTQ